MPNTLYPPLKPRSFAELLDAVLQIFRLSLLKCLPYATLAIIAGELWSLYYLSRGRVPILDANDPVGVTIYGVGTLIFVMLSMTILLRQSSIAAGRSVTGSADLLDTLRRAPAIVAISLLAGAAVAVFMVPALELAPPYRTAGIIVMLAPAIYVGMPCRSRCRRWCSPARVCSGASPTASGSCAATGGGLPRCMVSG